MGKYNLILLQVTKTNDGLMGWVFCLFVLGFLFCEKWELWWGFFLSVLHIPAASCPM